MLRRAISSSPRMMSTKSAPIAGRKVTVERIGQSVISPRREHEPRDQRDDADQHGESVVVEVAGLELDHPLGDVEYARRDAVRAESVDEPAVALLPQEAPDPLR